MNGLPSADFFMSTLYRQHYAGEDEDGYPPWMQEYKKHPEGGFQPKKPKKPAATPAAQPAKPQNQVQNGDKTSRQHQAVERKRSWPETRQACSKTRRQGRRPNRHQSKSRCARDQAAARTGQAPPLPKPRSRLFRPSRCPRTSSSCHRARAVAAPRTSTWPRAASSATRGAEAYLRAGPARPCAPWR